MALERLWSLVCVVLLVSLAYSANIDMCRVSQAIIDDDARVVACELDDSSSSFDAATMPLVHVSRRQLDYPAAHPISVNEVVHGDFESTSTVAFILRDVSSTDLLRAALTSVATGPRQPPQTIQLLINDAHTNTLLQVAEAPWPYCNSSTVETIVCQSATPQLPTIAYLLTVVGPQGAAFELSVALLNVTVELGSVHYGSFPNNRYFFFDVPPSTTYLEVQVVDTAPNDWIVGRLVLSPNRCFHSALGGGESTLPTITSEIAFLNFSHKVTLNLGINLHPKLSSGRWYGTVEVPHVCGETKDFQVVVIEGMPLQSYWWPMLALVAVSVAGTAAIVTYTVVMLRFVLRSRRTVRFYQGAVPLEAPWRECWQAVTLLGEQKNETARYWKWMVTLAVFFAVPAAQFVFRDYYLAFIKTGDRNACYFNNECARPWWVFFSFNNVASNVAFLISALGLGLLTTYREIDRRSRYMLRALAVAIAAEGVCSGLYHVCPTRLSFQLDTTFSNIISAMVIIETFRVWGFYVKAWQAFSVFSLFTVLNLIGTLLDSGLVDNLTAKDVFLLFSVLFFNVITGVLVASIVLDCVSNHRRSRAVWISIGVVLLLFQTLTMIIVYLGWSDFSMLYAVGLMIEAFSLMGVLLIASFHRYCFRQKVVVLVTAFIAAATNCSAYAVFMFAPVSDKDASPADSNNMNAPCLMWDFFDHHDLWHLLASYGLLLLGVTLNVLNVRAPPKPGSTGAIISGSSSPTAGSGVSERAAINPRRRTVLSDLESTDEGASTYGEEDEDADYFTHEEYDAAIMNTEPAMPQSSYGAIDADSRS